ncbi:ASSOCIATED INTERACTION DOMAINS-CONTAINING PROTEIN putative ISOFORM 1-RELATED [Salix purpurea]|uniref:ASSOCIATED INTERACTION DOMAINS-CONTAINING PROTEIN putative ISOFORM 1-RELATED n=1 Tax=Salix purpurea TaxID=77065 RepID=A0A9Q0ZF61_SALPP|nr:ASSOCIATED INTERACTION DOMAINS-CONTAINING PROTEIN putative ISOFORM 1-RELATED [Salix purpurea]
MAAGSCLPEDMIRETLLRLPVQSLLRFQAVCKRWLALITSSNFILAHCKHRPKHSIMLTNTWFGENYGISMLEADATGKLDHRNLPSSPMNNAVNCRGIGSSNGLLCVYVKKTHNVDYFLWNLATGKHRLLLFPPALGNYTPRTFGFGFVPEINDYKLLIVDDASFEGHLNLRAVVYTLSTDSWKEVEGVTVSRSYLGPRISVVVQGIWYDLIFREEENIVQGTSREPRKVPSILRFDMANDVFSKIEDGLPYDNGRNMNLMEYKELLAMGVYRDEVTTFKLEIWTLMKNENCWTKLFLCRPLPKIMTMMPLGFLNDKEIILSDYSTELFYDILQLYDPSTQNSSVVSTCEEFIYFETHNYVESLVSVDAPGHQAVCRCFPDMERIKPSILREQEKRKRKAGIDAFK